MLITCGSHNKTCATFYSGLPVNFNSQSESSSLTANHSLNQSESHLHLKSTSLYSQTVAPVNAYSP